MQKYVIVIDAQNDFISGSLKNDDAQKKAPNIAKYIRSQSTDTHFIYTLDTHDQNYADTLEGQKLPVPHCIRDSSGWNLNYEIGTALQEKIKAGASVSGVLKETFGSVDLLNYFKDKRAQERDIEIEVVGYYTDSCLITNALLLRTVLPNTKITCFSDLCAGTTKANHIAAIKVMKSCQIDVEREES